MRSGHRTWASLLLGASPVLTVRPVVVQGQDVAGGALARPRGEFCVRPDGAFLPAFTVVLTCCETG